jgi:Xaa-Pro aminopeptidase
MGDAIYPFRQNSDLFWLTGIEQEEYNACIIP